MFLAVRSSFLRIIAMLRYELIETNEGLTVIEIPPDNTAEDAARQQGGLVVDPGPFTNYEEAYEALMAMKDEENEEELD
jgi:hypothetical protein